MAIRDILIQVGAGPHETERLALAADLAERLGAALHGVHIEGPRLADLAGGGADLAWMASNEVQRIAREQEAEETRRAEAAHRIFEGVIGESPVSDWSDLAWASDAWTLRARLADLIIVGATDDPLLAAPLSPDRLACASGRPVLILPPVKGAVGHRLLIAWNGGREAARALHDAMPLIEQAQAVSVVAIETAEAPAPDLDELAAHLQAHGVTPRLVRKRGADAAALLLEEARSQGADLIIMGVYGRSRLTEWVLGGVSRDMLRQSQVPVLISH